MHTYIDMVSTTVASIIFHNLSKRKMLLKKPIIIRKFVVVFAANL